MPFNKKEERGTYKPVSSFLMSIKTSFIKIRNTFPILRKTGDCLEKYPKIEEIFKRHIPAPSGTNPAQF
jgi:hypothetical protein